MHDISWEAAPCAGSPCPARHPPWQLRRLRCAPARGRRRSRPSLRAGGAQALRAVEIPIYDFTRHQRSAETRRVEPADVVILEVLGALQSCSQWSGTAASSKLRRAVQEAPRSASGPAGRPDRCRRLVRPRQGPMHRRTVTQQGPRGPCSAAKSTLLPAALRAGSLCSPAGPGSAARCWRLRHTSPPPCVRM